MPVKLESAWINDEAKVPEFSLDELLATKLRALYQRKKRRDLFDLWYALNHAEVNAERVVKAFRHYLREEGNVISQKLFIENVEKKIRDKNFIGDTNGLLRSGIEYDIGDAYEKVKKEILEKL